MKAVVHDRYGPPDVLRVERPHAAAHRRPGRVKVAATSVDLSDWEGLRGSPAYARFAELARRAPDAGSDIAGMVDGVGAGVTGFVAGEEVYGDDLALMGGFAEFVVAPESALAGKPAELTFAEASTLRRRARSRCRARKWAGRAGC